MCRCGIELILLGLLANIYLGFCFFDKQTTHHRVKRDTPLTEQEKQQFLDAHNTYRRAAGGANMNEMVWDDAIAALAKSWAETCRSGHPTASTASATEAHYITDPNHPASASFWKLGQNAYAAGSAKTPQEAVDSWHSEVQYYTLRLSDSCQSGKVCGHYTQVVWADSCRVGCGKAFCAGDPQNIFGSTWSGDAYVIVCNYSPLGNFNQATTLPYQAGTACSQCDSGVSCNNGLCTKCGSAPAPATTAAAPAPPPATTAAAPAPPPATTAAAPAPPPATTAAAPAPPPATTAAAPAPPPATTAAAPAPPAATTTAAPAPPAATTAAGGVTTQAAVEDTTAGSAVCPELTCENGGTKYKDFRGDCKCSYILSSADELSCPNTAMKFTLNYARPSFDEAFGALTNVVSRFFNLLICPIQIYLKNVCCYWDVIQRTSGFGSREFLNAGNHKTEGSRVVQTQSDGKTKFIFCYFIVVSSTNDFCQYAFGKNVKRRKRQALSTITLPVDQMINAIDENKAEFEALLAASNMTGVEVTSVHEDASVPPPWALILVCAGGLHIVTFILAVYVVLSRRSGDPL